MFDRIPPSSRGVSLDSIVSFVIGSIVGIVIGSIISFIIVL